MRKFEETSISFVDDLIAEVPPMRGPLQGNIYRGQADESWELKPGMFRADLEEANAKSWLELANSNQLKFKQLAPSDLRNHLTTELDWIATACHHHAPTSFTAWSEAALVGLYFATEETPDQADGALWRFMPGDDRLTISQDYEMVPDAPRIYHPHYQTPEMKAQRVCFLTHPFPDADSPPVSFENYYEVSTEPMNLCKITIPHDAKRDIRRHIAALGFDTRNIFPSLHGLGKQLCEEMGVSNPAYDWIM